MFFSALAALALGVAGATSMSDALHTMSFNGTSVASRRLDETSAAFKKVAEALDGDKLRNIFGHDMLNNVPHEVAYTQIQNHLKHLEHLRAELKDQAVLALMEKHYGVPAVSRYVEKTFSDPNSLKGKVFNVALLHLWKKDGLSLHAVAEKMTRKDIKVIQETLQDFPRALLKQYAVLQGASDTEAEILTSAALIEHFDASIDSQETFDVLLPQLETIITQKSTSDLARILKVKDTDTANRFQEPNGRALILFVRLKTENLNAFEMLGRVRSLYHDKKLKSFPAFFWTTLKDVDIGLKIDNFVENVLPVTVHGKLRNFFRRMWFKLISIFKKKQYSEEVVSNLERPRRNAFKTPVNNIVDASPDIPETFPRSAFGNAAYGFGASTSSAFKNIQINPLDGVLKSLKAFRYENKELQLPIQFKVFSIEFAGLRNKLENTIDIADKHLVKVKEIFENERVKDLSEQPIKANAVDGTRSTVDNGFNQPYRRNTNAFSKYEEALISSSVSAEVIAKKLAQIADHVRQFVFKHEKPAEKAEKDVLLAAHPRLFKNQDKNSQQHTYGEALLKILDQEITNYMQKSESLNLDLKHLGSRKMNLISNEVEKALSKLTKDSHINGQPNISPRVNVLKLQT